VTAIKLHLAHHRRHMLACAGGAAILVLGFALGSAAVAIAGAVICGAGCLSMVWMIVTAGRSERRTPA
jgi:hypothetical protein